MTSIDAGQCGERMLERRFALTYCQRSSVGPSQSRNDEAQVLSVSLLPINQTTNQSINFSFVLE